MEKGIKRSIYSAVMALFVCITPQVRGNVDIYWTFSGGFSPSDVTIIPGETVYWWNADPYGFDLWLYLQGYSPAFVDNYTAVYATFNSSGKYNFSSDYGDTGSVTVLSSVNYPPVVTITNPVNNAVFPAPASFNIEVGTSDTTGDFVWLVEIFLGTSQGTNSIAYDYEPPFGTSVTDLGAGVYTLIAVGTDTWGATATNAITVTVGSLQPINLKSPRMTAGQFLFDVTGLAPGKTNVVQTSINLTSWVSVKTNVATAASGTVTNAPGPGAKYYRMVQWP